MPSILKKLSTKKLILVVVLLFFLVNYLWVVLDKQVPIIGDDPRFIQGAYDLSVAIKSLDVSVISSTWQNMYIHPQRFPRTPLFSVLAVPAFLLFGPSEDMAIISNLMVLAINSILIALLCKEVIKKDRLKWVSIIAVVLFNLLPGNYGFARLYMSEIMQTFFVLLITYTVLKFGKLENFKIFFVLGVVYALALLLRFSIPLYVVVPTIYFIIIQLKKKKNIKYFFLSGCIFGIGFIPIFLTWYKQNLFSYLEFSRATTVGGLAEYYSLGPVSNPITALKFFYVIITWVLGWPLVLLTLVSILVFIISKNKKLFSKVAIKKFLSTKIFILLLIPLPTLIATTLSVNKTSRYFVPVVSVWLILLADIVVTNILNQKIVTAISVVCMMLVVYPFFQSIIRMLPALPVTGYNYASSVWDSSLDTHERYSFFYEALDEHSIDPGVSIYNTGEQPKFNDAELIWYGTQHDIHLTNTDEFSRYSDVNEGMQEIQEADIIIVETSPYTRDDWSDKYLMIRKAVEDNDNMIVLEQEEMKDGSVMQIYLNTKISNGE